LVIQDSQTAIGCLQEGYTETVFTIYTKVIIVIVNLDY